MDFFNQILPGFSSKNACQANLSEENGIQEHLDIILDHLGREKFQFEPHPTEKGYFKLINLKAGEIPHITTFEEKREAEEEKKYFNSLEFYEKWHLTKQGTVYAYHKQKYRQMIYRTTRKPQKYSDIASQLPERDKVQIEIINFLGSQYEFQHREYMLLSKYQSSISQNDIIWTSKEYHRFYLESSGEISAGHGMNKEMVLDRSQNPVNTTKELKIKSDQLIQSIQQYLQNTSFTITNESLMNYSYDQPKYRLSFLTPMISTTITYEHLEINLQENVIYGYSHGQKYLLINAMKLPGFAFNPLLYFISGFILATFFLRNLFTLKRVFGCLIFFYSASLTNTMNTRQEISKILKLQHFEILDQEKLERKQANRGKDLFTKAKSAISQTITSFTETILLDVYLETSTWEEYDLQFMKLVFMKNNKLKPNQMVWILIFGKVFLLHAQ